MRRLLPLLAAGLLAGCSADNGESNASDLTGSEVFLELMEDARVAVRAGNLAQAGRFYDEARALEPENPGLWVDIARLRFRGGEHLTAIEAADYALELDPRYAPALLLRAQLVRDSNGLAESLPWFEAAVAADPANAEVLGDYAASLGDLGRYRDMLAVVRDLAEVAPGYGQVHYLQAVLAARANDPVLAGTLLTRSGMSANGVPAAMMLDAIINLQQGNYDTAAEILLTLSERQPANMRVSELLARSWWLGGRDREIVERFVDRAERPGASPYLVMVVGRSFERLGDRSRAIPFIERARETDNARRINLDNFGPLPEATARMRGLLKAGNTAQAKSLSSGLIQRFPQSGDIRALAGDAALGQGDIAGALELYEVAARVRRSWPVTRKLIEAYREEGDALAAEVLLARYIAGDPMNIEALFLMAEFSASREDWLRVEVLLDTAIALGAGNDLDVLALRADAARGLGDEEAAQRFDAMLQALKPSDFIKG